MTQDGADTIVASVPRALLEKARSAVAEGSYSSLDDVVSVALELWSASQDPVDPEVGRLRGLYDEGKASGPPIAFDRKRLEARLLGRIAARQRA